MNCLKCGTPIDMSRATCAACGTPIDADGNGLPDVLDKLVEQKVGKLLDAAARNAASTGPSRETHPTHASNVETGG